MTRAECVRKFKAAAKRVVKAERELDMASKDYDRASALAYKKGWKMPRTVLSNPFLR